MRHVRLGLLILLAVVAVATLRSKLPDPAQVWAALRGAHGWLLFLAVAAELASLRHFALQQRRLLAGFGVGMSLPRALAVTVSRTAMSSSLPGGSAISAAYAFRQFRTAGATQPMAGGVTVLSGLLSGVALALGYGVVMVVPIGGVASRASTLALVVTVLVVALAVFAVDARMSRVTYAPVEPLGTGLRAAVAGLRRLPPRTWSLSLLHALVNWATDFACLAAVAAALDLNVNVGRLATVYLGVQLARQVPLTPGGLGVVEVALLAALVSAGGAHGSAAAVVLIYRLISCWAIIPVGWLAYAVLRARSGRPIGKLAVGSQGGRHRGEVVSEQRAHALEHVNHGVDERAGGPRAARLGDLPPGLAEEAGDQPDQDPVHRVMFCA
jgi:uncharacterized membrane protein YbhN (UPF0104 family)